MEMFAAPPPSGEYLRITAAMRADLAHLCALALHAGDQPASFIPGVKPEQRCTCCPKRGDAVELYQVRSFFFCAGCFRALVEAKGGAVSPGL